MHRKNRPLLIAGLGVCSGFAAHAAMTFAGQSTLMASTPPPIVVEAPLLAERTASPLVDRTAADTAPTPLPRNVFCPDCRVDSSEASPPQAPASRHDKQTTLNLVLVGTMEGIGGQPSFATVFDADARAIGLYTVSETIRPDVVVASVQKGRVHVMHGAQREVLVLGARAPPAAPEAAPKRDSPPSGPLGVSRHVRCPDDTLCVVDRSLIDRLIAKPSLLPMQARVKPRKGKGFALYGIRGGSLPKALGLKNGDVVVGVNGQALDSVDAVMRMYTKLRNASRLEVALERRGKPFTKEIQIE